MPAPYERSRHHWHNTSSEARFLNWWTGSRIGLIFLLLGLIAAILGYLYEHTLTTAVNPILVFYANISSELIGIAVAVLIIDALARRRTTHDYKTRLVRELHSNDNGIALRALNELRENGWVGDGTLCEAYLLSANLAGAFLRDADLSHAWLRDANLRHAFFRRTNLTGATLVGADLTGARELSSHQLAQTSMLLAATLPNGQRYDGRFNLPQDLATARKRNYDITRPSELARFYGVPIQAYLDGQDKAHLLETPAQDELYQPEDWLATYLMPQQPAHPQPASQPNRTTHSAILVLTATLALLAGIRLARRPPNP